MNEKLPDSYHVLRRHFEWRVMAGSAVFLPGTVLDAFYVVISGLVRIETPAAPGTQRPPARQAGPGTPLGVAEAFSGRPTRVLALAAEPTVLLAVPVGEAVEAFRASPEMAVAAIDELASAGRAPARRYVAKHPDPIEATTEHPAVVADVDYPLIAPYDEEVFFADDGLCRVCSATFQYLRVRAGAVHPSGRDSDFHIVYRGADPTHYAIVVCPRCSFAAYQDDFGDMPDHERRGLIAQQPQRDALGHPYLCATRTHEDVRTALQLADLSYQARTPNNRRRAGLLHRLAWIAREVGDVSAEMEMMRQARDAYRQAYERDSDLNDETAVRAAYLVAELSLRLGEAREGANWFLEITRMPAAKGQAGILRMARERLQDARDRLAQTA